jgi:hypothetical protein
MTTTSYKPSSGGQTLCTEDVGNSSLVHARNYLGMLISNPNSTKLTTLRHDHGTKPS